MPRDAGLVADPAQARPSLPVEVVAQEQDAPGAVGQRGDRGQAQGVDRLAQPDDARRRGERAHAAGHDVVEGDREAGQPGDGGRQVEVELRAVDHDAPHRVRIAVGHGQQGRRVLGQDRVAGRRQVVVPHGHAQAAAPRLLGHHPADRGVQADVVAEPLELRPDDEDVALHASGAGERGRREDDIHPIILIDERSPVWGIAEREGSWAACSRTS